MIENKKISSKPLWLRNKNENEYQFTHEAQSLLEDMKQNKFYNLLQNMRNQNS